MRVTLNKLLENLGVGHVLSPYETQPWLHYDSEHGVTCSAEVRMGPGGDEIEAEIQLLYDEGKQPEGHVLPPGVPQQIMHMRAAPTAGEWTPVSLKVKGEDYVNRMHEWEEKGCNFFRACAQALQSGEMPDFDDLIDRELGDDDGTGGGRRGRVGRKAPKIKPAQLLGMKKGM